jgi:hypothetical protein
VAWSNDFEGGIEINWSAVAVMVEQIFIMPYGKLRRFGFGVHGTAGLGTIRVVLPSRPTWFRGPLARDRFGSGARRHQDAAQRRPCGSYIYIYAMDDHGNDGSLAFEIY